MGESVADSFRFPPHGLPAGDPGGLGVRLFFRDSQRHFSMTWPCDCTALSSAQLKSRTVVVVSQGDMRGWIHAMSDHTIAASIYLRPLLSWAHSHCPSLLCLGY